MQLPSVWRIALILIVGLLGAACAEKSAPTSASSVATDTTAAAEQLASVAAQQEDASKRTSAHGAERKIVSEASLALSTESPGASAETASRVAQESGGYVASKRAEQTDDKVVRVEMTLRIPIARLEAALSALRGTGRLLSEAQTGKDVTDEYTDVAATLREKQRLEQRLLAILDSAKSVKEMLEVEQELNRVRTDIERLAAQERVLTHQAALATLQLTFSAPFQPLALDAESAASRLTRAVSQAREHAVNICAGLIVATGMSLPFSLPLLAVYAVVRLLRLRGPRRRAALS